MESFYTGSGILTFLIFFPLLGAVAVFFAGDRGARQAALGVGIVEFLVSLPLFWYFDHTKSCDQPTFRGGAVELVSVQMQNCVAASWIPEWGIFYRLGLDGISLFMVLLTTLLLPLMVLGSWTYIRERQRWFYAMLIALTGGVVGVFVSLDMFLFYVFWEIVLIPMYFLIGIWGGKERVYAAVKFFLYTAAGSLLMLVAILYMFFKGQAIFGTPTFSYFDFQQLSTVLGPREQGLLFLGFALAFAVKVPIFPFHTWLPHAHVQAPTAGSVILAGVLLKMGTYGFMRFALPLFPLAAASDAAINTALVLAVAGIIYGALVAAVQPNAKKLVAYTSVAHLGFVILGIYAFNVQGIQGALMVMIGHGLSTPMLFFLLGMLYERRHTYELSDFGGMAASIPVFAAMLVFAAMATVGLPGTAGFLSEFLVLLGAFRSHPIAALIAATGVIFAAYYMLPMVQRTVFNALDRPANRNVPDLNAREILVLAPLVLLILWLGVYPKPVLDKMAPAAERLATGMETARAAYVALPPSVGEVAASPR